MMTSRQEMFRADYRAKISRWYVGPVHVLMIYLIGGAGIWFFAHQITNAAWYEWLVVPIAFASANIFEWWIHKFIMHRPVKGFMGIYKRHTLAHHQFFTDHEPRIDSARDFRIVFFPPYALAAFMSGSAVAAFALSQIGLANAGWLLLITNTALYLNYEFFHFCCHVRDDSIIRHVPLINTIRRHHIAHHNTAIMMERNFNLTYPVADCLFGTSDLDRGVIGHLFNGYDSSHVRKDLKRVRNTAADSRLATSAAE